MARTIKKSVLALLLLCLLSAGAWYAYQIWPRPMPAPLYSTTQFEVTAPAPNNAAAEYQKIAASNKAIPTPADNHSELLALYILPDLFTKQSMDEYWDNAAKLLPGLQEFLKQSDMPFADWQRLREMPVLVDETQPNLQSSNAFPVVTIIDLHRIFELSLVEQMLDGKIDAAYSTWRKQYVQDLSWVKSARSLVSVIAALTALSADLGMLRLMVDFHPPENRADWIQFLKLHPIEGGDYRRPLRFQYLTTLGAVDYVSTHPADSGFFGKIHAFNPARMRQRYNDYFTQVEKVLAMPMAEQPKAFEELGASVDASTHGQFWWVRDASAKAMARLMPVKMNYFTDIPLSRDVLFSVQRELILALQTVPEPVVVPESLESDAENPTPTPGATPSPRPSPAPLQGPAVAHPSPTPILHEE